MTLDADDASFLAFARTRDAARLEPLLRAYHGRAFTQAQRLLGSAQDAEDAVQEAFLQLVRGADRYDGSVPFPSWLGRLVHLAALAIHRARRRRRAREARVASAAATTAEAAGDDALLAERVRRAVAGLPERYRATLDLHYFAGLDQRQTAAALGISVDAVAMRLHRGRERLRTSLAQGGAALPAMLVGDALAHAPSATATAGAHIDALVTAVATRAPLPASTIVAPSVTATSAAVTAAVVAAAIAVVLVLHRPPTPPTRAPVSAPVARIAPPPPPEPEAPARDQVQLPFPASGAPVFSPDGRLLALRTDFDGSKLEVVDIARTLAPPGSTVSNLSVPLAPQPRFAEDGPELGTVAAFAGDSGMVLTRADASKLDLGGGGDGLVAIAMPLHDERSITEADRGPGPAYVPFLGTSGGQPWPVLAEPRDDGTATLRLLRVPATMHGRELTPRIRPGGARWSRDGATLIATLADGALARIALDGEATPIIPLDAATAAVGKPIERIELLDEAADGALLAVAWRPYPAEMKHMHGTFVPSGDEAPAHGRNPGSAEPGPEMPRYVLSWRDGKLASLHGFSLARHVDRLLLMPTPAHDAVLTLQLVNEGYAGHSTPHAWLGRLGADGTFAERDLGNPFALAEGGNAGPTAEIGPPATGMPIEVAADGSRALVLMARAVMRGYAFSFWVVDARAQSFSRIGGEVVPTTALIANDYRERESTAYAPRTGWVAINLCAAGRPPIPQGTLLLHAPRW